MKTPKNIFITTLVFALFVSLIIIAKIVGLFWVQVEILIDRNGHTDLVDYPSQITWVESQIRTNNALIKNYNTFSVIQQSIVQNISEFSRNNNISIISMPKTHQNQYDLMESVTIQIQVSGNLKNQLLLIKNFEDSLNHIPLKSCTLQKTKNKLIGSFIFQYKSPIDD